jgi:hypothetical protein
VRSAYSAEVPKFDPSALATLVKELGTRFGGDERNFSDIRTDVGRVPARSQGLLPVRAGNGRWLSRFISNVTGGLLNSVMKRLSKSDLWISVGFDETSWVELAGLADPLESCLAD